MAEKFIHIVRIRCEKLTQAGLFDERLSPTEAISKAILARPAAKVRRGTEWHVGDTETLSERAVAFQLGRMQSVNAPQFDESRQIFFETDAERAPYTWGVYDKDNQSCAIIKQSGVSLNAYEIGAKLEHLLNSSGIPGMSGYHVVVDVLRDPEDFISQMNLFERIVKFSFTAQFENAHDVYKLIHRPAEKFNEIAGGSQTKVEINGDNLDKDVLEELSRSVASTGDEASATIKNPGQRGLKRIFLRGTPLLEHLDPEALKEKAFSSILESLRTAYNRLRQSEND